MGPGLARALACPLEVRAAAAVSQGPQAAQTSMASTRSDNESHVNVEVKVPYRCPGPLAEQRDLQMPVALGLGSNGSGPSCPGHESPAGRGIMIMTR